MSDTPSVSLQTMHLSDGRSDHYVSITVGDRQVHPHMFRDKYKAAYHVALYRWLFAGGEEPDLLAFNDGDFPAQATRLAGQPSWQPIATAPKDRTEVIIACPCATAPGQHIVSAAYFDPDAYGGTWWWSGTQMGEWGDSPVEDINEAPTFWQPMPAGPTSTTIKANGGDHG